MTDHFTQWVVAVPLKNIKALTVTEAFFERWVLDHMPNLRLLSDRGTQFTRVHYSLPSQINSNAERLNRYLGAALSLCVNPSLKDCGVYLPSAVLAYRSSAHDATQFSPCYLLCGKVRRKPYEVSLNEPAVTSTDYRTGIIRKC
jgi:hypothetical protein